MRPGVFGRAKEASVADDDTYEIKPFSPIGIGNMIGTPIYWDGTTARDATVATIIDPSAPPKVKATLARKALPATPVDPFTDMERDVLARAKSVLGYTRPLDPHERPLHKAL